VTRRRLRLYFWPRRRRSGRNLAARDQIRPRPLRVGTALGFDRASALGLGCLDLSALL
jgi:hypothetical protein